MSMMDLAHHIIAVAHKNNIPVTNLQLQKVMFFSLKYAMNDSLLSREVIEATYDSPFLVWRYGPVEKDIYERYKVYGSDPILEKNNENENFRSLNDKIIELLNESAFKLVRKSHEEPFWRDNEKKIKGWRSDVKYTLSDVAEE
ncbi:Panacea domain-containing protein [Lactiplantibacillus pentosus]|uniref:Panacea domain-containing protein n=1 Tax=Lactiplantibacillus pentosus TaxID=1589 RepID=UPI00234A90E9|nr:type II toxin-antitoxin system antitoxin SocA domain-containing protein [Lactiplantibacillus pentosus]MDC6396903.1 DUF4065 domain-containing protein [Lactiplantibacillus pentosus]